MRVSGLARASGPSKSTVSIAMANVERAGLVREAGHRRGAPGRAAQLYEVTPEAGFVLALDVGRQFLRGALADLTGSVVARETIRSRSAHGRGRVAELIGLADALTARAGISRAEVTQTVIGCPGVYDRHADTIRLTGGLTGWDQPGLTALLRESFGASLRVENDVDAAALAEQAHGHGRHARSFAFATVGTGIGMGLVLDGRPRRGAHGIAGEIAFLPFNGPADDAAEAARRGSLEAAVSSAAVTRAARDAGMRGSVSPRGVFAAAARATSRPGPSWRARPCWWPSRSARSSPSSILTWWCWAAASDGPPASPMPSRSNWRHWRRFSRRCWSARWARVSWSTVAWPRDRPCLGETDRPVRGRRAHRWTRSRIQIISQGTDRRASSLGTSGRVTTGQRWFLTRKAAREGRERSGPCPDRSETISNPVGVGHGHARTANPPGAAIVGPRRGRVPHAALLARR